MVFHEVADAKEKREVIKEALQSVEERRTVCFSGSAPDKEIIQ